jgi:PST family polysaccharide transporter
MNMVIGIVKVKVLAVLLGPVGVGLMGLYQNIMSMTSTLAGCGLGSSGVRQLATSAGEASTLAIVRRALWLANVVLGTVGMALLWVLRAPVAQRVFGDTARANDVGWLGAGVLLTLVAGSQTALLQGLRRIGDIARVNVLSALLGAATGILFVSLLRESGVLWFVLTAPAVSVAVAGFYTARLPRNEAPHDWGAIAQQWREMLQLGIPLMAAALLTLGTQLATRSLILHELGLHSSGYFQAAWTISMTYTGFVLGAMSTDYYPRLTAVIGDHTQARKLVNEQTEMALLLSGPLFLAMMTLAPVAIHLLYASSFSPSIEVLRWQVLGDILKVASWPMGFILLAQGRGNAFIATELTWNAAYLGSIFVGIHRWGLIMAGVGFWIAYLIYFCLIAIVATRLIAFKPARRNSIAMLTLSAGGTLILVLSTQSLLASYVAGLIATMTVSVYNLRRMDNLMDLRGWLQRKFKEFYQRPRNR